MASGASTINSRPIPLPLLRDSVTIAHVKKDVFNVRDDSTHQYFQTGREEAFLLESLRDGITWQALSAEYESRFNDEITRDDFRDFIQVLENKGFLEGTQGFREFKISPRKVDSVAADQPIPRGKGSLLFYRVRLCNPDRFLGWFVETFWFCWTRAFFFATIVLITCSASVMFFNLSAVWNALGASLSLQNSLLAPFIIVFTTALHELGHGATCKKYGGRVREAGFLLMLFIPCLYVNVSDAWMIPSRKKRLAITIAGGYIDVINWALSVLVWRVTIPGTLVNDIAFLVLVACGSRSIVNFNPFVRMDGYYILADVLNYSNLYSTSHGYWKGLMSWAFWGSEKPATPKRWKFTLAYGIFMWLMGIVLLNIFSIQLFQLMGTQFGIGGIILATVLMAYGVRRVFRGFIGSELLKMLRFRLVRSVVWMAVLGSILGFLYFLPLPYYISGDFEVRSARHVEITSPLNGFLESTSVRDGQFVKAGDVIAVLRVPELQTEIETKNAELEQSRAQLKKLQAGPRREEIMLAEERTRLLSSWVELGEKELEASKRQLTHEIQSMDERCEQVSLQVELAEEVLRKSQYLYERGAVTGAQLIKEKSELSVLRSQLLEVKSQREARKIEGVRSSVAELERRKQDLLSAQSSLDLLKLGYRTEEIAAEQARCRLLEKELAYLEEQKRLQVVVAPSDGIVSAPRFGETVGSFAAKGSSLCELEDPGVPQIEIYVSEDDAALIQEGLSIRLKARSLPYEVLEATVERVAPAADKPSGAIIETQLSIAQTFVVYCSLDGAKDRLKPGMTGFGRIMYSDSTLGQIVIKSIHRYVRTEFWW